MRKFWQKKSIFVSLFAAFAICLSANSAIFAAGVIDNGFGMNGAVTTIIGAQTRATDVIVQPDGKIVVVGYYAATVGGQTVETGFVARFNSSGSLDAGFATNGVYRGALSPFGERFQSVAVDSSNRILVAGAIRPFEGSPITDFLAARFNENGSLDTTFGSGGIVALNQSQGDELFKIALQSDGKIVTSGGHIENNGEGAVFRFNANGSLDSTFGSGGGVYLQLSNCAICVNERITDLEVTAGNQILLGGTARINSGSFIFLVKLNSNGETAGDFGTQGFRLSPTNGNGGMCDADVLTLANGEIVISGCRSSRRFTGNGGLSSFDEYNENVSYKPMPNGNYVYQASEYFDGTQFTRGIGVDNRNARRLGAFYDSQAAEFAVQPDSKLILLNRISSDDGFVLSRVSITSWGTRFNNLGLLGVSRNQQSSYAVYRPSNQTAYISDGTFQRQFQTANNAGKIIFERSPRIGKSYALRSWTNGIFENFGFEGNNPATFQWGVAGDVPVGGDYDADGVTDYGVFRPSNGTWYFILSASNQFRAVQFGQAGDKIVPADYDYDGETDVAVWRPSNGVWYVLKSLDAGFTAAQWGLPEDKPVSGDFDADGRADFAVWRPSNGTWYILNSTSAPRFVQWGQNGDVPVSGDFDGDGRHDPAIFRDGLWYTLKTRDGASVFQWGQSGDIPIAVNSVTE